MCACLGIQVHVRGMIAFLHVLSSVCIPFTCLHSVHMSACVLKRLHSAHMSACALKCLHCDHMSACAPAFRSHVCMCSSVCIVCIVIIRLHAPLSRRKNVNSSSQGAGMIGLCHTRVRTEVCVHMDTCLCPCLITNQTYN